MKAQDIFSYAFGAIKLRKLRAALTILGVVIGITAVVALLSITQGMQMTVTGELQRGFAADTIVVMKNSAGGASSNFKLYANYTDTINGLSPVIDTSFATIMQPGYLQVGDDIHFASGIVGLNFSAYQSIYSKTFTAQTGTIPLNPGDDEIVIGAHVSDPMYNGTKFLQAGDNVTLVWINATTIPYTNTSYTTRVAGVLPKNGGFGISGPSDDGVYISLSKAESFLPLTKPMPS
jgi:putative ABC transport system permease protein